MMQSPRKEQPSLRQKQLWLAPACHAHPSVAHLRQDAALAGQAQAEIVEEGIVADAVAAGAVAKHAANSHKK